jgi:phage I-like protein
LRSRAPCRHALAACAFNLPQPGAADTLTVQLTPAGDFRPDDGRTMKVPAWHIDRAVASRVIERFQAKRKARMSEHREVRVRAGPLGARSTG